MKRSLALPVALALLAGAVPARPAAAQASQSGDAFHWTGRIPQGRWIRIRNLNGPINVTAASGDNVEVTATKRWRRGDPADVHFETLKTGSNDADIEICALWGADSHCDDNGSHNHGHGMRNNDVRVDFEVHVPRGVKVDVGSVNGEVRVDGATSQVDASSVNGGVDVTTSGGPVNAESVNGAVHATMGRFDSDQDMNFETVNGSVIVEFTGDVGADVEMSTVNGSLHTDYEMTVSGRLDPKHLRAHIGKPGGPHIRLTTVNGSVELRRR